MSPSSQESMYADYLRHVDLTSMWWSLRMGVPCIGQVQRQAAIVAIAGEQPSSFIFQGQARSGSTSNRCWLHITPTPPSINLTNF